MGQPNGHLPPPVGLGHPSSMAMQTSLNCDGVKRQTVKPQLQLIITLRLHITLSLHITFSTYCHSYHTNHSHNLTSSHHSQSQNHSHSEVDISASLTPSPLLLSPLGHSRKACSYWPLQSLARARCTALPANHTSPYRPALTRQVQTVTQRIVTRNECVTFA